MFLAILRHSARLSVLSFVRRISGSLFRIVGKRLPVNRQDPFPEHQRVCKEQSAEYQPCGPFRQKQGDAVHIPTAKQAAQDAEIQGGPAGEAQW